MAAEVRVCDHIVFVFQTTNIPKAQRGRSIRVNDKSLPDLPRQLHYLPSLGPWPPWPSLPTSPWLLCFLFNSTRLEALQPTQQTLKICPPFGLYGWPRYPKVQLSTQQVLRTPPLLTVESHRASPSRPYPGLTISKECVSKVEAAYNTRKGVISRSRLDAALHRCHLHVVGAGLLCQLCIGLLQLVEPEDLRCALPRALSAQYQKTSPSKPLLPS